MFHFYATWEMSESWFAEFYRGGSPLEGMASIKRNAQGV